ncbi:cupin domain-containing protein [Kordiimonas lacus]|uniref:Mannose-6-phosphate isomerase, cupin superfamily n=1 Tax=Kordiimonas lacus TaxID=637679 RepID=A0A1G6WFA9_9PROT|nr:cupin domain-containing protein [Kordiimonas lacus]SDD64479.1 Mannose-6-phosphate isomerase, cupin superfamily [Kordiimonas lacus]
MKPVNLKAKLTTFSDHWSPKLIGDLDGYHVKLAKLSGDFVWHAHEGEDEFFLVIDGRFRMDYRDRQDWIEEGEMVVVPKGVEHKPYAPEECSVLLIEKASTDHTGGVDDPRRVENPERI